MADVGRATDDEVERHEHVLAVDGAVLERDVQRQVASANLDAGRVTRNERHGNATVLPAAQQAVRVEQAEGQTDDGGDGGQRDVALREIQLQPDDLAAFPLATAHHTGIGQRCGVRTRTRAGEREAGHFATIREAGQVVVALRLRTVVQQQFRWPQGIRHGDGGAQHAAAARQLHQDAAVGIGTEAEPAVFLRDDHREKAATFEERPYRWRQVAQQVGGLPVIVQAAQFFAGPIEERLFLGRQLRRGGVHQLRPVGVTGE